LRVERKILDVDFAFTAQHNRGQPFVLAVVVELDTSRKTVQVSTKIDGFIRASYKEKSSFEIFQNLFIACLLCVVNVGQTANIFAQLL
jgi:hypothetical protein